MSAAGASTAQTRDVIDLMLLGCDLDHGTEPGGAPFIHEGRVRALLRLELPAGARLGGGPEALALRVTCDPDAAVARLRVGSGPEETFSFADVPAAMRSRALALALAEALRRGPAASPTVRAAEAEAAAPTAAPARKPAPPVSSTAAPPASPRAPAVSVAPAAPARIAPPGRALRDATIGLFSIAVAGFAVGAPITAVGQSDPEKGSYRGNGALVLGLSIAPLVAASVTFGLWMHQRRRAAAIASSTPSAPIARDR